MGLGGGGPHRARHQGHRPLHLCDRRRASLHDHAAAALAAQGLPAPRRARSLRLQGKRRVHRLPLPQARRRVGTQRTGIDTALLHLSWYLRVATFPVSRRAVSSRASQVDASGARCPLVESLGFGSDVALKSQRALCIVLSLVNGKTSDELSVRESTWASQFYQQVRARSSPPLSCSSDLSRLVTTLGRNSQRSRRTTASSSRISSTIARAAPSPRRPHTIS